jgi:hypothetical protein
MNGAIGERRPAERNGLSMLSFGEADSTPDNKTRHAIFLRKLPSNSDKEAVRNILLFAKDLVDCEMVPHTRFPDDKGFASAIAYFQTYEGAKEARDLLNGKRNATKDATLIVEVLQDGLGGAIGSRRNTVDSGSARHGSIASSTGIAGATSNGRQSSRYNGTFQNMEKMSPPNGTPGLGNGEFGVSNLFSPTSPVQATFAATWESLSLMMRLMTTTICSMNPLDTPPEVHPHSPTCLAERRTRIHPSQCPVSRPCR